MAKKETQKIKSRPGLFGTTIHYDEKGRKIGESRLGFFGATIHTDAKGKLWARATMDSSAARIITTPRGIRWGAQIPVCSAHLRIGMKRDEGLARADRASGAERIRRLTGEKRAA